VGVPVIDAVEQGLFWSVVNVQTGDAHFPWVPLFWTYLFPFHEDSTNALIMFSKCILEFKKSRQLLE
jgi:hypothetical protein